MRASADAEREIKRYKDKPGIGAQVRVAQLLGSRGAIQRVLAFLWRDIGNVTQAGRREAQAAAIEQSFDWDEVLLRRAIPNDDERQAIRNYLLSAAEKNVDAMIGRAFGGGRITLSQQVYKTQALAKGWVERTINSALTRGATVSELAKEVKGLIRPDTKGGVSYAAFRLAQTEINNAYHAQSIEATGDKPWVNGMRWRLSNSHPRPDECNQYAEQGIYPVGSVPKKPHPKCLCYVTPELVSVAEFNRNLQFGYYDAWIDEHYSAGTGSTGRQVS